MKRSAVIFLLFLVMGCVNPVYQEEQEQVESPLEPIETVIPESVSEPIPAKSIFTPPQQETPPETSSFSSLYTTEEECVTYWTDLFTKAKGAITVVPTHVEVQFSSDVSLDKAKEKLDFLGYSFEVWNPGKTKPHPLFPYKTDQEAFDALHKLVVITPEGKEIVTACDIPTGKNIQESIPEISVNFFKPGYVPPP
jgi:hypothetical protein